MWSHECPTFNGQFGGTTVTCPFHGSNFDVVTGKKLTEPILTPPQGMEPLPQTWQKYLEHARGKNTWNMQANLWLTSRPMIKRLMKQDLMEIESKSRFSKQLG